MPGSRESCGSKGIGEFSVSQTYVESEVYTRSQFTFSLTAGGKNHTGKMIALFS